MPDFDLLIDRVHLASCDGPDDGTPTERLDRRPNAAVALKGGRIAYLGESSRTLRDRAKTVVDAEGGALLPSFVDPHTHLIFAGSRIDEFARRMAGEDYKAIAAEGGGIKATVRGTREASDEALYARAKARALALREGGVLHVEVKSGYGLSTEEELRHLRLARQLQVDGLVHVTTSLLGAHALPPERTDDRDGYVQEVANVMIPRAKALGLADAVDVYLDVGAFTRDEAAIILKAAKAAGLKRRAHVGQFADLGGAELVAELEGLSADHLEEVSDAGLAAMGDTGVRAVLLPGAWTTLRQQPVDIERLRRANVRIAIGTDCNPGTSPTTDLALMAALAVRDAGLTLEEALLAITREAACAAGFAEAGRLRVGEKANLVLYREDDPRVVGYALGGLRPRAVWMDGRNIAEKPLHDVAPLW